MTSSQREAVFELAKYCDGRQMPHEVCANFKLRFSTKIKRECLQVGNDSTAMTRSTTSSQVQGKAASSTASRKSDGESKSKDQAGGSLNRVETGKTSTTLKSGNGNIFLS